MDFGSTLQEKLGPHSPEEIEELILDSLFKQDDSLSKNQKDTLEKYNSLIHLSMKGIGIKSLKNMPKIETLQILELSDNKLTGSDLGSIVALYPNLYKLKLTNNQIASLDVLKSLQKLKINKIYLEKNPCAGEKNFTSDLFSLLTELVAVDSKDKEGQQVESTIYEEEDEEENELAEDEEEFDDDDEDDEEFNEEEEQDEDDDEEEEEEEEKPKKKKKH